MDDARFDRLARALGSTGSRRAAVATLAGLLAGESALETRARKKRKPCDPACAAGQTCRRGACACDDGGAVCGASCCAGREVCEAGACVTPPRQCIPAGEACKGVGRRCCDGLACGSGQGGQGDVACYVPAGGPCATTADCVYGSDCIDRACVARPEPMPAPCRGSIPVTGDPVVDGEALRALAEDPEGPSTITLCAGLYRATQEIAVVRDLAIEAAADAGGEVILDGGWSGGDATDGHRVIEVTAADVRLTGITVRRGHAGGDDGGCLYAASGGGATALTLTRVRVTTCKAGLGGGIVINGNFLAVTLVLHDSEITGCTATNAAGGFHAVNATVTLDGTTRVTGNRAIQGGGFSALAATVTLGGTTRVSDNTATGPGGGFIATYGSTVTLSGSSRVSDNTASVGGGFHAGNSTVALGGTARVTGNRAAISGAGFFYSGGSITCTGTPKVCANPGSGSAGCDPGDPCGSLCAPTC